MSAEHFDSLLRRGQLPFEAPKGQGRGARFQYTYWQAFLVKVMTTLAAGGATQVDAARFVRFELGNIGTTATAFDRLEGPDCYFGFVRHRELDRSEDGRIGFAAIKCGVMGSLIEVADRLVTLAEASAADELGRPTHLRGAPPVGLVLVNLYQIVRELRETAEVFAISLDETLAGGALRTFKPTEPAEEDTAEEVADDALGGPYG